MSATDVPPGRQDVDRAKGSSLRQGMIDRIPIANPAHNGCIGYIDQIAPLARHYNTSRADLDIEQAEAVSADGGVG